MYGVLTVASVLVISSLMSIHRLATIDASASKRAPNSLPNPAGRTEMPPYTFRFELPNFSVSLPSTQGKRTVYAQFSLVLDCPNFDARRALELNRAKLRDVVLSASLGLTVSELQGMEGIAKYKKRLLAELRTAFGKDAPRDLSLEQFLLH